METGAHETFDSTPNPWVPVKGLNRIIGGQCARIAWLVRAELVRVSPFFTAALSNSGGMVSEAI